MTFVMKLGESVFEMLIINQLFYFPKCCVRFKVLAAKISMFSFWVVMLCGHEGSYQHFGETFCFCLQPWRCREYVSLKRWYLCASPHCVTIRDIINSQNADYTKKNPVVLRFFMSCNNIISSMYYRILFHTSVVLINYGQIRYWTMFKSLHHWCWPQRGLNAYGLLNHWCAEK